MEEPQVKNLAGLVGYQEDSVVSRTVLNKQTGTVTLFALDQGQTLSEHTAPFDAMVHVLDGRAEVTISGNTVSLGEGEMIVLPANVPHALRAEEKFKMLLVMIKS